MQNKPPSHKRSDSCKDSGQRDHELCEVFNGLPYIVKTGAPWRFMPHGLPPWTAVYRQTRRWLSADRFGAVAGDLRAVAREAAGREPEPSAVILDSRPQRSSPESGERASYDGAKRTRGSKVHLAVETTTGQERCEPGQQHKCSASCIQGVHDAVCVWSTDSLWRARNSNAARNQSFANILRVTDALDGKKQK